MSYVSASDYDVQLQSLMKELWSSGKTETSLPSDKADKMLAKILETEGTAVSSRKPGPLMWKMVAASLVIIASSLGAFYYIKKQSGIAQPTHTSASHVGHQIIKLPDGSVVTLNAGSTLDYPINFTGSTREVFLRGEAYFDVHHDASRTFVVHAGKIQTAVLGTAFNIKAYESEEDITVTVTRGKVKVSNDNSVLGIITPDQQIVFHKDTQFASQQSVDSKLSVVWAERDILFDDITIEEAVQQLEERFQVTINLTSDRIKNCRFTATFVRGEDLKQILTVICEFNRAEFVERKAGVFEVSGNGC